VDESGCDKRIGFRRTGWSPLGTTPVQVSKFHRDQRYQILPAYAQDGIIFSRVFQGSTDASFFEDFIEELLQHCGKYPDPKSVLIMDNASFHRSERIEQMCLDKGVKLVYLPPYSPDLNPIEEFFAELKAFIRRHWQSYADNPRQGLITSLTGVLTRWEQGTKVQEDFQNAELDTKEL
jgi:transposase